MKTATLVFIILILSVDQISKILIKTNFLLNEDLEVFSWFKIAFVENDGMAWGTTLSDVFSFIPENRAKLILTFFRIIAVTGIGIWLYNELAKKKSKILICAISMIFAGALGNIFDSVFYGMMFSDSYNEVATFLPEKGGYAPLFYGKVVDMFHFPIWRGVIPESIPIIGGSYVSFFDPVFNVADVAITTGIGILILFNRRAFQGEPRNDTSFLESHNSLD